MDCGKAGFVFTTFAFHMHAVTIAYHGFAIYHGWGFGQHDNGRGNDNRDSNDNRHGDYKDRDDAIKAFLIIAYLLYLFAFLIQVIQKAGEDLKLSEKIWGIILFIVLIVAGIFRSEILSLFKLLMFFFLFFLLLGATFSKYLHVCCAL